MSIPSQISGVSTTGKITPVSDELTKESRFLPSRRDLCLLFVGAIIIRVAMSYLVTYLSHHPMWMAAYGGDGVSYLRYALLIAGHPSKSMEVFDLRVFPGMPLLIAGVLKLGGNLEYTGLGIAWISGGVAAAAAAALYRDKRVGIAVMLLLPDYISATASTASEGPMLALTLLGLLLATRQRWLSGGLLFGMAGLCRPMACFAVVGFLWMAVKRREWRGAVTVAVASLAVVAAALIGMHIYFGNAMKGIQIYANSPRAYGGDLFLWPMESLIMTPFWFPPVSIFKIAMVWGMVLFVAGGCFLTWRRFFKPERSGRDIFSLPWLLGNSLFALFVGGRWGFQIYPRLQIPSEPALFWAYERWLPRRWYWWALIGIASFGECIVVTLRHV